MLTAADLVELHRRAFKPRERWAIGLEMEKMAVDARSGRPLPYDGASASVRSVLVFLAAARPSEPLFEDSNLIALAGEWGTITLEPGGQVEWSSPPAPDLLTLERLLCEHIRLLEQAAQTLGLRWLQVALQPDAPLSSMPWMPKRRYRIMREYFRSRGSLAHRMMTQTASIQVSLDYSDEADWREKFRAGFYLAPIAVAAFANSRRMEGRDTGYASFRSEIWRHTDDDRCGAPPFVFQEEFGFEEWVGWVLDVPAMFTSRNGVLEPAGGVPFRQLLEKGLRGSPVTLSDWELHLTEVFPETRAKTYIELRSADLPPDDRLMAVPAFWTGLLSEEGTRSEAIDLLGWGRGSRPRYIEWLEAMKEASKNGLAGRIAGRPVGELVRDAAGIARQGLARIEPAAVRTLDALGG